jgi:hypothetical protein
MLVPVIGGFGQFTMILYKADDFCLLDIKGIFQLMYEYIAEDEIIKDAGHDQNNDGGY